MLQQHCKTLQAWGTGLETDQSLLTQADLTPRHKQAISARIEYKSLIQAAHLALETYKASVRDTVVLSRLMHR